MVDKFERRKDVVQELTESTATHVGRITMIITNCIRDVTREIGDLITDGFEMREASKRAARDTDREAAPAPAPAELPVAELPSSSASPTSSASAGETDPGGRYMASTEQFDPQE